MSISPGPKSIAEVVAEAEKQKVEAAKRVAQEYAQRRKAAAQAEAQAAMGASAKRPARVTSGKWSQDTDPGPAAGKRQTAASAASAGTAADDLRDEFDFALEAVETARRSVGRDKAAVEKMAVSLLVAKTGLPRDEAPRYVRKAIQYLDG